MALEGAISNLLHEYNESLTWAEADDLARQIVTLPEMMKIIAQSCAYQDLRR